LGYAYVYAYNFIPVTLYTPFLGHTWSLAVEEHFYLVWPTIFLLLFKSSRRGLAFLLIIFIACAPVAHLILVRLGLSGEYFVARWTFIAGAGIATGCLAALVTTGPGTFGRAAGQEAFHRTLAIFSLCLFANPLHLMRGSWFVSEVAGDFVRMLGISLFVVWIAARQGSFLVTCLEWPPLKYLGIISYGVYMYQGLFLGTGPVRVPGQFWPPDIAIGVILLVIVAPISYHYFELPILNLKNRFRVKKGANIPASI
jgi:peptidoglycan/LPS O-acetylase OafA/YrhL